MKPDDRDIICEQDYTPLSNAELVAAVEQHAAIMYTSPIIDFDLEWITGPARALLARAEAAEARVVELEAQLAAQQWRPVTEEWPPYNERVIIGHGGGYGGGWYAIARRAYADVYADKVVWLMDDDTTLAFESATVAMIVPPLPQEPTP